MACKIPPDLPLRKGGERLPPFDKGGLDQFFQEAKGIQPKKIGKLMVGGSGSE
jgi:hypothetical protein